MTELAFGDRIGRGRDPFGDLCWVMAHVADLTSEEMETRSTLPAFIEAMACVQRADMIPKRQSQEPEG